MHDLLRSQLCRHLPRDAALPERWRALLREVDATYAQYERELANASEAFAARVAALRRDVAEGRRVEAVLRESEAQFRTLAEHVAAATFIYRGTHFLYVNAAGLTLTGYDHDELLALDFWDLVQPEHRALVRERGLARQRGEAVTTRYEFAILTKTGETRWVDFTAGRIVYQGEPAVLGTAFDITEHRRAREALERQAQTFANLYDAVIISDRAGRITDWNPGAERMYGFTRAEALDRSAELWLPPDQAEEIVAKIFDELHRSGRWSGEVPFVRRDGSRGISETVVVALHDADGLPAGALGVNRDVTERTRAAEALRESEARYRTLFEESRDAILMTTPDGRFIDANEALLELFGYDREELLQLNVGALYPRPADRDALLRELASSGFSRNHEVRLRRRDGTPVDCLVTASVRRDREGRAVALQGIIHDISERKRVEERLAHDAMHDALTNLPNRALFLDRLRHADARVHREADRTFAVLFLDLDRFKVVNDSLGHAVGDELLRSTGARLAGVVRPGDTVARFGGDEFTVLLEDVANAVEATHVADRILESLAEPFALERHEVFTSASIGIALADGGSTPPEELLRNADAALGRAKAAGKSRYEVFDRAMHSAAMARLGVETDLRRALSRDELRLVYQPVVELATGEIVGFEALVRWDHPERGVVMPLDFIPVAEEMGLIFSIGRWVVERACADVSAWRAALGRRLTMAVNISARQLSQRDLVPHLERTLSANSLPAEDFGLEITEGALIESADTARRALARVRELGVELHLDDFGTGYSSLGWLHRLPVSALKIDRSFVRRMDRDMRSAKLVHAIVALARSLGVATIAEGVASAQQRDSLRELGCDCAQGFHFARPTDPAGAMQLLASGTHW